MSQNTRIALVAVLLLVVIGGSIAIAVVATRKTGGQHKVADSQPAAAAVPDPQILRARQVAILVDMLSSKQGAALKDVWHALTAANVNPTDVNANTLQELGRLGRAMGEAELQSALAPYFPFEEGKGSECCRDLLGLELYWKSCKPCNQAALRCAAYDQMGCKEDVTASQLCHWDGAEEACKNRSGVPGVAAKVSCQVRDDWFRHCGDTPFVNDVGSWATIRASRNTQLAAVLRKEPKTPGDMVQLSMLGFGASDLSRATLLKELQRQGSPVVSAEEVRRLYGDLLPTNDTSTSADGFCCEDTLKLGLGWKDCAPCERVRAPCTEIRDAQACSANSSKCLWSGNTQSCSFKVDCGASTSKAACGSRAFCAWNEDRAACENDGVVAGRQVPCGSMPLPWFRACVEGKKRPQRVGPLVF